MVCHINKEFGGEKLWEDVNNLNNYHVIYGSDEPVDMETHKDFGCVNFEE